MSSPTCRAQLRATGDLVTVRPALPHVLKHSVHYTRDLDVWMLTVHSLHDVAPDAAMVAADRAALRAWLADWWRGLVTNDCTVRVIKSISLQTVPPTKFAIDHVWPETNITGASVAQATSPPAQLAAVVSLRTGAAGTAAKPPSGRIYHGRIPTGQLTATGAISQGFKDLLTPAYHALRDALDGIAGRGVWIVPSYWHDGTRAAPVLRVPPLAIPVTHVLIAEIGRAHV